MNIIAADYSNSLSLVSGLRGQDALVSLVNRFSTESQNALLDAAIEAGVQHIIPSCFGQNTQLPEVRASPFNITKIQMEDYLVKRAGEGKIVYTIIQTSVFFEWAIGKGMVISSQGPTYLFDQGAVEFSTTCLDDVGKAVANALQKAGTTDVDNKVLLMHSTVLTQQKALQIARKLVPGNDWNTISVDSETAWNRSKQAYAEGSRDMETLMGFFARPMFGTGEGLFRPNDNEVLGIREWTDTENIQQFARVLNNNR